MVQCPFCDSQKNYKTIGNHWRQSCRYPKLGDLEMEMMEGLMMGDAVVKNKVLGNTSLDVISTNQYFLRWLHRKLGVLSTGVHLKASVSDLVKQAKTSNVYSYTGESPPRPVYRLTTRNLPDLNVFREWYKTGEKRYPNGLELTPINAKFWYIGDGGLSWNKKSNSCRAQICTTNEIDRASFLLSLFKKLGVSPRVYSDRIMFDRKDTTRFLEWLGPPIPGFEYKWMDVEWADYKREFDRVH